METDMEVESITNTNGNPADLHSEEAWYKRFIRDYGEKRAQSHPSVVPWSTFYLQNLALDPSRGSQFAKRAVKTINELLNESLTTLQELALDGDDGTFQYQIGREKMRNENFNILKQNSLPHFSVLAGSTEMIKLLFKEGGLALLNKGDLVTHFTPFEYALFTENLAMMQLLINLGVDVDQRDSFFGTAFDYARMVGILPSRLNPDSNNANEFNPFLAYPNLKTVKVWSSDEQKVAEVPIHQVEKALQIDFTPVISCGNEYIEELMFSGFAIQPDLDFRKKYLPLINASSGDENLILARIDDHVGWGVFAAKDFEVGDFIVRYGGKLTVADTIKDKSYNMSSIVEGMGLNAIRNRNFGGMINHCVECNAECEGIFEKGAELAIITATKRIPKGHQILINYSKNYWTKKTLKSHKMTDLRQVPALPL